jgi:hypothetical protein
MPTLPQRYTIGWQVAKDDSALWAFRFVENLAQVCKQTPAIPIGWHEPTVYSMLCTLTLLGICLWTQMRFNPMMVDIRTSQRHTIHHHKSRIHK